MRKYLMLLMGVISLQQVQSQEIYFYTGVNLTKYDYKDSQGISNKNLQNGTGAFYEIGYAEYFDDNFNFTVGMALDAYNAVGGNTANKYSWDTKYLGVKGTTSYSFIKTKEFEFAAKGGLNLSTIVYGKQEINNAVFDIKDHNEFSGILLTPLIGLQARYSIRESGYLSVGYNLSKGFNISNTSAEKLSFNNNQFQIGVHFAI
jgi:hypothetical protein